MAIICKQCGYENPDGSTVCEICAESLVEGTAPVQQAVAPAPVAPAPQPVQQVIQPQPVVSQPIVQPAQPVQQVQQQFVQPVVNNVEATIAQVQTVPQSVAVVDDGNEYFVLCPESQTKTILPSGSVTSFYCEGCKKQHEIDGFLWNIEKREKQGITASQASATSPQMAAPKGDNLWLEEVNSHVRIDIDKAGGILGRYGKYGSDFFQSRGFLMVSGEHCMITYEFGNWVIRHISRTNQTMYNNMVLGANEPNLLEDGKVLTLANAVSFIVRIG